MNLVENEHGLLKEWLYESALPFWADTGVDRCNGGFNERLTPEGDIIDDPRRARLVARQIYVYATAGRLGWSGNWSDIVNHGQAFLGDKMLHEGTITPVVHASGAPLATRFDLYDQAFVLFALAFSAPSSHPAPEAEALEIYKHMACWRHGQAGYQESIPATVPLKANPHMHLLEAALAWEAKSENTLWPILADELAGLCLDHLIAPATGAVHEYFDQDWKAITVPDGPQVEPGHQYEWAWLLIRWGELRSRPDALSAARRLITLAETHAISSQGLAMNGLAPDLSVTDRLHRLWPQTERIKALAALAAISDGREREWATEQTGKAIRGLMRFFDHPVNGAWWEHLDENGAPLREPTRASSLYHITCAYSELDCRLPALI